MVRLANLEIGVPRDWNSRPLLECGKGERLTSTVPPKAPGLLLLLLAALCFGTFVCMAETPLKSCAEVRALPREVAEQQLPVEIRGIVTLSMAKKFGGLVVQDKTAGDYVDRNYSRDHGLVSPDCDWPETFPLGAIVEIKGVTWGGHFAPVICPIEMRIVGQAPLPEAPLLTFSEVLDGKWDCQRARLRGTVQYADNQRERSEPGRFDLVARGGRISVYSLSEIANPDRLVDSEVEASGVVFTYFNKRGELVGARLQVTQDADFQITKTGPANAFDAPEVPLAKLRAFSPNGVSFHRCRCSGTVTLAKPGQFFYIQEEGRGVRVETRDETLLEPGDQVEVAGFVEVAEHFGKLREAVFRKLGRTQMPTPFAATRRRMLGTSMPGSVTDADDADGSYISLQGHLEKVDWSAAEGPRLFVESEGHLVTATLIQDQPRTALSHLEVGSEVDLHGIARVELSAGWPAQAYPTPVNFQLLIHSPSNITILRAASWWTLRRLWLLLGGTCGILAITLFWNWLLRRRVEQRSRQLAEEMRARREASVEFEATLRERERLAADLHDTLEQSLTSLALQLEAGDALREDSPERSAGHLKIARQLLLRSREEVRRSVWNLRAQAMEGRMLPDALREIAAGLVNGCGPKIEIRGEGEAKPLPDFVGGNLLLLAQEAMTNALKHSGAGHIQVTVGFHDGTVKVAIQDNGTGFDLSNHPGPREGHFGLQGMRERMKRVGGTLEVASSPGSGTSVTAIAPIDGAASSQVT